MWLVSTTRQFRVPLINIHNLHDADLFLDAVKLDAHCARSSY